jgi:hypothetical protein
MGNYFNISNLKNGNGNQKELGSCCGISLLALLGKYIQEHSW